MLPPSVFRLPKAGSTQAEYEDAVAWSRRRGRFAVADGASASAFARLWAQLLVQAYVGGRLSPCAIEHDLALVSAGRAAQPAVVRGGAGAPRRIRCASRTGDARGSDVDRARRRRLLPFPGSRPHAGGGDA